MVFLILSPVFFFLEIIFMKSIDVIGKLDLESLKICLCGKEQLFLIYDRISHGSRRWSIRKAPALCWVMDSSPNLLGGALTSCFSCGISCRWHPRFRDKRSYTRYLLTCFQALNVYDSEY